MNSFNFTYLGSQRFFTPVRYQPWPACFRLAFYYDQPRPAWPGYVFDQPAYAWPGEGEAPASPEA